MANSQTFGWDWSKFKGSRTELKWNRRDMLGLDKVIALTPRRSVAIQAGGNLGMWPKRLSEFFETVYAFEPAPDLFPIMFQNAPEKNIVRFQAALGEKHEFVRMLQARRDNKPRGVAHEGITHVAGPGTIPTLRVDDFEFPACDLIYLDLEGWELYALRGAAETIKRHRPVIAVEINKCLGFLGLTPDDVRQEIVKHYYQHVLTVASDEVYVPAETLERVA